jgi:hypothetical protein
VTHTEKGGKIMTDKDKTEATTTDENQDAAAPEQQTTPPPDVQPDGESGQDRVFTPKQQDHINKIVGERAAQATRVATEKILTRLGTDSIDDAASIMEAHAKAQEAEMSEVEKLQKKLDQRQADTDGLREKHSALLTKNAILLEANEKKHGLSSDIHGTLLQLIDMTLLNVGDDGVVTGADKAIEQAIKDHPVLKANGSRGDGFGSPIAKTTPSLQPEKQDGKTKRSKFRM